MTGGTLNAPWGFVAAPANFGEFANDVLVGNFGDGSISAFDTQGNFLDQVKDSNGNVIFIPGLWELVFGVNGTGDPNTLYLTAGGSSQTHGLFATLVPTPAAGTDFTLGLSAASATVARGSSTSLMIDASGSGGFNGTISLSCSGQPAGVTCAFAPASILPDASSALTISVGSTYVPPMGYMAWAPLTGFGLLGLVFGIRHKHQAGRTQRTGIWALGPAALLFGWLLQLLEQSHESAGSADHDGGRHFGRHHPLHPGEFDDSVKSSALDCFLGRVPLSPNRGSGLVPGPLF